MAAETQDNLLDDPRIHANVDRLRQLGPEARRISLLPNRQPAGSVLNGRHASRLRGRGLNFEELRAYVQGDDVRTIDWKVTVRTGEAHVRVYTEERDRPTLLLVDQRTSMYFGSAVYMKSVIAAEAAAIAAHAVIAQGDRVGGVVFGDEQLAEHRPQRSRVALHRFLTSIARANSLLRADKQTESGVDMETVLKAARKNVGSNALILVFSDFADMEGACERHIRALAKSNDLILFNVADPFSEKLPDGLKITVSDGELQAELNLADSTVKRRIEALGSARLTELFSWSRKYGFPIFPMTTEEPALNQILRLTGHRGAAG